MRFVNAWTADGQIVGEVAPLIRDQQTLNAVNFDRLIVSRFGAFPQKVISGWSGSKDQVLAASARRVWTFEDAEVKATTLAAGSTTDYNAILEEIVQHIALRAGISLANVTGKLVNVSAEALAAAEANQQRKLAARRESFGESWEQVLRLAAAMDGDEATAADSGAEVVWRDTEARAFAAVVDGIAKLTTAGIPLDHLVPLVPGLSQQQVQGIKTASRDTILDNVEREGVKWARYASSTACGFCRMLATRGAVYNSEAAAGRVVGRAPSLTAGDRRAIAAGTLSAEQARANRSTYSSARAAARAGASVGDAKPRRLRGNQQHGERYHRNCRCVATAVRAGDTYEPPAYVQQWEDAYQAARKQAKAERLINGRGVPDPAATANLMDSAPGARRDPEKSVRAAGGAGLGPKNRTDSTRPGGSRRPQTVGGGGGGGGGGTPPGPPYSRSVRAGNDDESRRMTAETTTWTESLTDEQGRRFTDGRAWTGSMPKCNERLSTPARLRTKRSMLLTHYSRQCRTSFNPSSSCGVG